MRTLFKDDLSCASFFPLFKKYFYNFFKKLSSLGLQMKSNKLDFHRIQEYFVQGFTINSFSIFIFN